MAHEASESAETERLLAQAEAGDRAAVESLFAGHRDYLHRRVDLRMDHQLRARIDVSDVIQEAHVEAARRMGDFLRRRPMPFRIWLRKTAYECLLRLRRRHVEARQRAVRREVPLPERSSVLLAGAAMSAAVTPSEQLIEQELARRVREAMAYLPDDDREILLMRNFEELSNQEVAQVLGIEAGTASKRYMRALFRLREVLVANGLTESET